MTRAPASDQHCEPSLIVTVNGGSSSIKFAAFTCDTPTVRVFHGQIERIGTPHQSLSISGKDSTDAESWPVNCGGFDECARFLANELRRRVGDQKVVGIGHRIVHGGLRLIEHQRVTEDVLRELRRSQPLDVAHLPREIELVEAFGKAFAGVTQVACLDTAFHRDLPRVAQLLPIPRRYLNAGVRRFGFHGLSYTYLMKRLRADAGPEASSGRVILAHLGSGASMTAVRDGKPVDTTMAFTPDAGLVMGTRTGDIDPGLIVYLMKSEKLSADALDDFVSQQCGLLGVSETSSDMRELTAASTTDPRAAEAVKLFCYQAKKHLCALASTLCGLDTLVFSGGIGEHSAAARAGIADGLQFLGLNIDSAKNAENQPIISGDHSPVTVRVISTDEEIVIVDIVREILGRPVA